jgi:hypothetical protein
MPAALVTGQDACPTCPEQWIVFQVVADPIPDDSRGRRDERLKPPLLRLCLIAEHDDRGIAVGGLVASEFKLAGLVVDAEAGDAENVSEA